VVADLGPLTPVAVLATLYGLGLSRSRARIARRPISLSRLIAGWAGIGLLAVALGPPLDARAATDLAAHMAQHVALLAVVPPLLIVGEVPALLLAAASERVRDRLRDLVRPFAARVARVPVIASTVLAIALQSAALGVWHIPAVYDAAVAHVALHAAEHLSFLLTGLFFWWVVAGAGRRAGTAAAVLTIFVASLPGTLLGALMTLSTAPWYPAYATGSPARALQDQQVAGVIMWAVGGMVYVAAGAALFVAWMRDLEASSPARAHLEPIP
jgi:cytochrome c oxidase assembly factor CtaG